MSALSATKATTGPSAFCVLKLLFPFTLLEKVDVLPSDVSILPILKAMPDGLLPLTSVNSLELRLSSGGKLYTSHRNTWLRADLSSIFYGFRKPGVLKVLMENLCAPQALLRLHVSQVEGSTDLAAELWIVETLQPPPRLRSVMQNLPWQAPSNDAPCALCAHKVKVMEVKESALLLDTAANQCSAWHDGCAQDACETEDQVIITRMLADASEHSALAHHCADLEAVSNTQLRDELQQHVAAAQGCLRDGVKLLPHQIDGLSWMVWKEISTAISTGSTRLRPSCVRFTDVYGTTGYMDVSKGTIAADPTSFAVRDEDLKVRGAILADEAGLGKTLTTLCLIASDRPVVVDTASAPPPVTLTRRASGGHAKRTKSLTKDCAVCETKLNAADSATTDVDKECWWQTRVVCACCGTSMHAICAGVHSMSLAGAETVCFQCKAEMSLGEYRPKETSASEPPLAQETSASEPPLAQDQKMAKAGTLLVLPSNLIQQWKGEVESKFQPGKLSYGMFYSPPKLKNHLRETLKSLRNLQTQLALERLYGAVPIPDGWAHHSADMQAAADYASREMDDLIQQTHALQAMYDVTVASTKKIVMVEREDIQKCMNSCCLFLMDFKRICIDELGAIDGEKGAKVQAVGNLKGSFRWLISATPFDAVDTKLSKLRRVLRFFRASHEHYIGETPAKSPLLRVLEAARTNPSVFELLLQFTRPMLWRFTWKHVEKQLPAMRRAWFEVQPYPLERTLRASVKKSKNTLLQSDVLKDLTKHVQRQIRTNMLPQLRHLVDWAEYCLDNDRDTAKRIYEELRSIGEGGSFTLEADTVLLSTICKDVKGREIAVKLAAISLHEYLEEANLGLKRLLPVGDDLPNVARYTHVWNEHTVSVKSLREVYHTYAAVAVLPDIPMDTNADKPVHYLFRSDTEFVFPAPVRQVVSVLSGSREQFRTHMTGAVERLVADISPDELATTLPTFVTDLLATRASWLDVLRELSELTVGQVHDHPTLRSHLLKEDPPQHEDCLICKYDESFNAYKTKRGNSRSSKLEATLMQVLHNSKLTNGYACYLDGELRDFTNNGSKLDFGKAYKALYMMISASEDVVKMERARTKMSDPPACWCKESRKLDVRTLLGDEVIGLLRDACDERYLLARVQLGNVEYTSDQGVSAGPLAALETSEFTRLCHKPLSGKFTATVEAAVQLINAILSNDKVAGNATKILVISSNEPSLKACHTLLAPSNAKSPTVQFLNSFTAVAGATGAPRMLHRFKNDPACRVLLLPYTKGGEGVTLTEATVVILLEPPSTEQFKQSVGRIYRLGQQSPTFCYMIGPPLLLNEGWKDWEWKFADDRFPKRAMPRPGTPTEPEEPADRDSPIPDSPAVSSPISSKPIATGPPMQVPNPVVNKVCDHVALALQEKEVPPTKLFNVLKKIVEPGVLTALTYTSVDPFKLMLELHTCLENEGLGDALKFSELRKAVDTALNSSGPSAADEEPAAPPSAKRPRRE